jgi:uncharacterized protein (AIM24 family)
MVEIRAGNAEAGAMMAHSVGVELETQHPRPARVTLHDHLDRAFDPSVEFITREVTKGIMQTLKSSVGFVMEFTGPGRCSPRRATRRAWSAG